MGHDRYYIGTSFDCFILRSKGCTYEGAVWCAIDLPFSVVLDTVLLPLDFILTQLDGTTK